MGVGEGGLGGAILHPAMVFTHNAAGMSLSYGSPTYTIGVDGAKFINCHVLCGGGGFGAILHPVMVFTHNAAGMSLINCHQLTILIGVEGQSVIELLRPFY
jgi:hypothetical protein